ncbi:MAG: hypothetical protein EZS28_037837 [Streblomastix strix]|uniref:Uncharacterized protein n=1 Tax=Streblomastix strix TaxID=222440 RepID=A0A5J4U716_9EUKA|nr:MAG: hypothetical protein EZS28_037837 [Streblomastix strix]
MTVPSDYNVINGLIGLGPDILLDVLSDFRLIPDAVQFLCVCKKTNQLINHARFYKIIESLNYPIEIMNKDPDDIDFVDIDLVQKKIYKKKDGVNTISLTQVLDNGIWLIEALFQNTYGLGCGFPAIGIVRDSYDIPAKAGYASKPHTDHIAAFCTGGNYPVYYKGYGTKGNYKFKDNQVLRLEFDSFKGTLILFIDYVQQPVYFSGIKEKVRFIISLYKPGSSCTIRSLKKLQAPTSKQIANEKAIKW